MVGPESSDTRAGFSAPCLRWPILRGHEHRGRVAEPEGAELVEQVLAQGGVAPVEAVWDGDDRAADRMGVIDETERPRALLPPHHRGQEELRRWWIH
jgi:hypothetical protein